MDWRDPWDPEDEEEDEETYLPDLDAWLDGSPSPAADDPSKLLHGGSPRQILGRLVDGDPLDLEKRCRTHLRHQGYFVDPDTVLHRSLARIAYDADLYRPERSIETFVERRVRKSVHELVEEQLGEELGDISPGRSTEWEYYRSIANAVSLPPDRARRICCALNALPVDARVAFHRVLVERAKLRAVAEELGRPLEVVQHDIRAGLLAIAESLDAETRASLADAMNEGGSS